MIDRTYRDDPYEYMSQEPCDYYEERKKEGLGMTNDLISRSALKRDLEISPYNDYDDYLRTERLIDDAPTVEERPKGKWRSVGFEKGYAFCICSNCGNTTRLYRDSKNEFCCIADIRNKVIACLYCGADMRGDV